MNFDEWLTKILKTSPWPGIGWSVLTALTGVAWMWQTGNNNIGTPPGFWRYAMAAAPGLVITAYYLHALYAKRTKTQNYFMAD